MPKVVPPPGSHPNDMGGRKPRVIKDGNHLWQKWLEYVAWREANPFQEVKAFGGKGGVQKTDLPKRRPLTLVGFCNFLGITKRCWGKWRKPPHDLAKGCEYIENLIYEDKFDGAAAGIYNSSIIARDLGLADKKEVTHNAGEGVGPKVPDAVIADRLHPDCTPALLEEMAEKGIQPMLYSQAQIDAGVPLWWPKPEPVKSIAPPPPPPKEDE